MKFNDFTREKSADELRLNAMSDAINMMCRNNLQHTDEFKSLIRRHDDLQYALHRARITNDTNKGVSMSNTNNTTSLQVTHIAKRAKYVQRLVQEGYDGEELMSMDLATLRDMVESLEVSTIVETYCNPNGTVSRKVTERKAA